MDRSLDTAIGRLRARAAWASFAGLVLAWLALGCAVLGAVALLLRAALGLDARTAALGFLPLVLVPVAAAMRARRMRPSVAGTAAWLDVRSGGSGAVVAALEARDARWEAQVGAALERARELPRLRLARPAWRTAAALAFAGAALFVPLPERIPGPPLAVQEAALERVEEQLAVLQEQVELDEDVAQEMRDALKRLEQEGGLLEPESAFEALDRVRDRLEQEALERAETAQGARDDLARAADQAASNPEAGQQSLERTLAELAEAGLSQDVRSALEKELGLAGIALPAGMKLDAAQLQALSKELTAKLGERIDGLAQRGLLDARALAKLGELAKLDEFRFSEHVCDESCEKEPGGT